MDWLSTKPRDRGRRKGTCKAGDFLIACGSEAHPGTDQQEWADAIEACLDIAFPFFLGVSAWDAEAEREVARRQSDFPMDPNNEGHRLDYVLVTRQDGTEVRIQGRQRVAFYLSEDQD